MKKAIKIITILVAIVFIALQFIRPERTNPAIVQSETIEYSTKIPTEIQTTLKRSCIDCHSNSTNYPWYSNVSPISWKVVEHIDEGREELNFSKWNTYSKDRKLHKLEEICEEVENGNMPHNQYLWIHWDAILTEKDKKELCRWTEQETLKINAKK